MGRLSVILVCRLDNSSFCFPDLVVSIGIAFSAAAGFIFQLASATIKGRSGEGLCVTVGEDVLIAGVVGRTSGLRDGAGCSIEATGGLDDSNKNKRQPRIDRATSTIPATPSFGSQALRSLT